MLININCSNCKHRDHTGSYGPGGAKPICRGPNARYHAMDWDLRDTYDTIVYLKKIMTTKRIDKDLHEVEVTDKEVETLMCIFNDAHMYPDRLLIQEDAFINEPPSHCPLLRGEEY